MTTNEHAGSAAGAAWSDIDLRAIARKGPVHFVGIGGAGMSALADLVLRSGGRVTGCDTANGPMIERLRASGATILRGHDAAHVADAVAVVATSAVTSDHPELVAARARGIPVLKRAQALGTLVNRGTVIAVAGTHGKTTTTAMVATILSEASLDPTAFVGGVLSEWGSGLRSGSGSLFVVEADEYDRSFLTLRPHVVVVTSIEADHLDVYGSIERIEEAFRELMAHVPESGLTAVCADDPGAMRLATVARGTVVTFGMDRNATLRADAVRSEGRTMRFEVIDRGESLGEVALGVPGEHNVRNALGAIAAARHVGADMDAVRRALASFHGVGRRFQELATVAGITVIDDYAHHPTEIEATLATARAAYPGRRIVVAFQPHLYSRTRDFARAFGEALARADMVWITAIYPAREAPIQGVTSTLIADAAVAAGAPVRTVDTLDALVDGLAGALREGDVFIAMGAGDIDSAAHAIVDRLHERGGGR